MRDAFAQDLRYAARLLRRSPVFSLTAVLSLALGIGPNAAIFSLVNALLLKSRPGIHAPGELVDIGRSQDGSGFDNMSYPNYVDLRDGNDVFADVAGYDMGPSPTSLVTRREDGAERIFAQTVSANFFSVLGVTPAAGRFFVADEDRAADTRRAVVLSDRFWARRFNRDPSVVGRTVLLNGQDCAIVGVAAAGFNGPSVMASDVWVPVHAAVPASTLNTRAAVWMVAIGRLKPGVTVAHAQAALTSLGASLERAYPDANRGKNFAVAPSRLVPIPASGPLYAFLALLMTIVGLVLLIACVNLTGMLLARAAGRQREIAVRLALGASRGRVMGQLVSETLMLFLVGGVAGFLLGRWLIQLLLAIVPELPFPVSLDVTFDANVAVFTIVLAAVAGVASGLVPALQATRAGLVPALKDDPAAGFRLRRLRLRSALVVSQVALSLLLLVAATLFVRSLQHAAAIDPGFDPANVEIASFDLRLASFDQRRGLDFARTLLARTAALPGVRAASFANSLPLGGGGFSLGAIVVPGVETPGGQDGFNADWNLISPSYFETLHIPIVRGRGFDARDRGGAPGVAIVNETMAARLWPKGDAVGRRLILRDRGAQTEMEIVGVARDSKYRTIGEAPRFFVYAPLEQQYTSRLTLLVRTDGARSVMPALRALVRDIEPALPVVSAQRLTEFIGIGLLPQRVLVSVAGTLGVLGLLLAALGVYGVTAYAASRRTREIGIRMALGADRRRVLRLIMGQGMGLVGIGIALGAVAALGVTRFVAGLLYGITPADPVAYGATIAAFMVTALLACYLPARRAASIPPTTALRHE